VLDTLFQHAPIGLAFFDRERRYVRISDYLAQRNGLPVEAHLGRTVEEVLGDVAGVVAPLIDQVFATGQPVAPFELQADLPGAAAARWWLASFYPVPDDGGGVELVGASITEITERKRVELALAESQERLELATAAAGAGVWEWRLATNEMIYSEEAKAICGFPPGEPVTFDMVVSVTHPEDYPLTFAQAQRALDPEIRDDSPYEYRLVRPDGEERWVMARGRAVFEGQAAAAVATRYVGTLQDITDRKRAEIAAAEAAARLQLAIDAGRMAVWHADETGVQPSPELNRLLGLPEDAQLTLEEFAEGYPPGERERVRGAGVAALARGDRHFEVEFAYRRRDGEQRWLAMRAEILPGQRAAIGVIMDITERKQVEERLKLLAREVDHRANNLMSVVQGTVALSRGDTPAQLKAVITGRVNALARAHQLLSESRWQGADLRRLVEEELLAFSLGDAGRVRIEGPDVALGPAAAQALAMSVHELATNAVKYGALSAPQGRVEIAWRVGDDGQLRVRWRESGGPTVTVPVRRGLGSSILERSLTGSLGGRSELDWRPEGLVCELALPHAAAVAEVG
jgi:PAS domain S-box-containing protein